MTNQPTTELKHGSERKEEHVPVHEKAPEAVGLTGHELQELAEMVMEDILDMVGVEERRVEKLVMGAAEHLGHEKEGRVFVEKMEKGLRVLEGNTLSRIERILE